MITGECISVQVGSIVYVYIYFFLFLRKPCFFQSLPGDMGLFLFTEGHVLDEKAVLNSPISTVTHDTCLSFSFWMHHQEPFDSVLKVYFVKASGDIAPIPLGSYTGPQGSSWVHVKIEMNNYPGIGRGYFVFEAVVGHSQAVIGLDDVSFGPCDEHQRPDIPEGPLAVFDPDLPYRFCDDPSKEIPEGKNKEIFIDEEDALGRATNSASLPRNSRGHTLAQPLDNIDGEARYSGPTKAKTMIVLTRRVFIRKKFQNSALFLRN